MIYFPYFVDLSTLFKTHKGKRRFVPNLTRMLDMDLMPVLYDLAISNIFFMRKYLKKKLTKLVSMVALLSE